jgi:hypothetical protein
MQLPTALGCLEFFIVWLVGSYGADDCCAICATISFAEFFVFHSLSLLSSTRFSIPAGNRERLNNAASQLFRFHAKTQWTSSLQGHDKQWCIRTIFLWTISSQHTYDIGSYNSGCIEQCWLVFDYGMHKHESGNDWNDGILFWWSEPLKIWWYGQCKCNKHRKYMEWLWFMLL